MGFSSDVFQLGAVFSEMNTVLTKRSLKAFEAFREKAVQDDEFGWQVASFRSSIKETGEWLDRRDDAKNKVIKRMISKNPDERPTALQVLFELRAVNPYPECDCMLRFSPA
jgi:serine/threonine protein kinase